MTGHTPSDDLQFSTAEPVARTGTASAVTCAQCAQPIATHYYTAVGRTLCGDCKATLERALAGDGSSRAGRITKSLALGVGAAVLGAAIWYGVAAMIGWSFGIVAIAIGFIVGRAVQMGSGGRGGQRYQVAAALLTYLSIVMSHAAMSYRFIGFPTSPSSLVGALVLPIADELRSMPGGLMGLAIMGFGMYQAWQMNAPVRIAITGPHRIGAAPDARDVTA